MLVLWSLLLLLAYRSAEVRRAGGLLVLQIRRLASVRVAAARRRAGWVLAARERFAWPDRAARTAKPAGLRPYAGPA